MEYLPGISLLKHLKNQPQRQLSESEVKLLWKQLIETLAYLHEMNITHWDIKLENIILSEDLKNIKLIDFGFSICALPHRKLRIYCGTPSYMAP